MVELKKKKDHLIYLKREETNYQNFPKTNELMQLLGIQFTTFASLFTDPPFSLKSPPSARDKNKNSGRLNVGQNKDSLQTSLETTETCFSQEKQITID